MRSLAAALLVLLSGGFAQAQPVRGLAPVAQPGLASSLRAGKAYALIIATDDYDDKSWPHLNNPVNDAQTIAAELRAHYGYEEPDLLFGATVDQVYARLATWVHRKFELGDSLLIFIAGHGKFDATYNRGYLAFKDSRLNDSSNRSYMPHSDLSNAVDAIQCQRILLVIDACFGGTFENQIASRGAINPDYPETSKADILNRKSNLTTRLFLTSGGREYVPDGRPGAHSPFASQILRALRTYGGASGLLTSMDIFQQVDKVTRNNPQYGWFGKADPGSDFWFVADGAALNSVPPVEFRAVDMEPKIRTRVNSADGLTYVYIPAGDFQMGCSPDETGCDADEKPSRPVRIARGFWLSQTEVTQTAWKKVSGGENPSHFKGDDLPVETVDWNQAATYCKAIGGRLPNEQEWEYAARGGSKGPRYGTLDAIGWYAGNSHGTTHPVAEKAANLFGLFDMLGNVWEWTSDNYNPGQKVSRGGDWWVESEYVRASYRVRDKPTDRDEHIGFRCVLN